VMSDRVGFGVVSSVATLVTASGES
jgi:hypothetical protein